MRKTKLKGFLISTAAAFMILNSFFASISSNAGEATVREDIRQSASSGKIIIGIDGVDYTSAQQDIVDRINKIRLEACKEGVPDPRNSNNNLSLEDYNPIKLGVNCTKAAVIRSAEGSIKLSHARPNSYICSEIFDYFYGSSVGTAENLNWNGDKCSDLEGWYSEKEYWVNHNTGYETGHYETLIDPDYNYCGIASFNPDNDELYTSSGYSANWTCTAGTFSPVDTLIPESSYEGKKEEAVIQKTEANVQCVQGASLEGNPVLHVGDSVSYSLNVDVAFTEMGMKCTTRNCKVYDGVAWSSSDNTVVSINSSTGAINAKKAGQVKITATLGGNSSYEYTFDCVVINQGVTITGAENPEMVYTDSNKKPVLSNSVKINLSDGSYINVTPKWDSYDTSRLLTYFQSREFDITGTACGFDIVQRVHVNPAGIVKWYPAKKENNKRIKVESITTDSGSSITYPGEVVINSDNGYSYFYPATWTTSRLNNYKNRAGGTFTEEGYTTVSTDEGSRKLDVNFELIVNPASVTGVSYGVTEVTTPSGTKPVYPDPTVTWSNGDKDTPDNPCPEAYGYMVWEDEGKTGYKNRDGGSYTVTGHFYDAINKVAYDDVNVTVNVTPATITSVEYDDSLITVENGVNPQSKLPATAKVIFSNGDEENYPISWNTVSKDDYCNMNMQEKDYTVEGQIDCGLNRKKTVSVTFRVKPPYITELEDINDIEVIESYRKMLNNKLQATVSAYWSNSYETTETITWNTASDDDLEKPNTEFLLKGYLNRNSQEVEVKVKIIPKSLTDLSLSSIDKNVFYDEYKSGQIEGKVSATYDNETTEEINIYDNRIKISDIDLTSKESSQEVSFSYMNGDTPVKTVKAVLTLHKPYRLNLTAPAKLSYIQGQSLDLTGMVVSTYYDDDTLKVYEEPEKAYTVSGFDATKVGIQTISVTQDNLLAGFDVEVEPKVASEIQVSKLPLQKVAKAFKCGDAYLTIKYNDGEVVVKNLSDLVESGDVSITGFDKDVLGQQTVTITFNESANQYDKDIAIREVVEVKDKIAINVEVVSSPEKTKYIEGQDIDLKGAVIRVDYDNDTSENLDVTDKMISGYDKNKIGDQVITVTKDDQSDSFTVNVREKQIDEMYIYQPEKLEYIEGETFRFAGCSLYIFYDNDTSEIMNYPELNEDIDESFTSKLYGEDGAEIDKTDSVSLLKSLKAGNYSLRFFYKDMPLYTKDDLDEGTTVDSGSIIKFAVKKIAENTKAELPDDVSTDFPEGTSEEDIKSAIEGTVITVPCADGETLEVEVTADRIGEITELTEESATEEEKEMMIEAAKYNKAVKKIEILLAETADGEKLYTSVYIFVANKNEGTPDDKDEPGKDDQGSTDDGSTPGDNKGSNEDSKNVDPAVGETVTVGNAKYKVTGKDSASYSGPVNKKVKSATIPASVKINGKIYKITEVGAGAFSGCTRLTSVVIGSNISKIKSKAFYNCKSLKKITIKSKKLKKKSIGSKAFKGTNKKAKVKVPKSKVKTYKKYLRKAGLSKKAKVRK